MGEAIERNDWNVIDLDSRLPIRIRWRYPDGTTLEQKITAPPAAVKEARQTDTEGKGMKG